MRIFITIFSALFLSGCGSLYPEYKPLIQEEVIANRDQLARELAERDPPSRLLYGMMIAKARCDHFWQELEQSRTQANVVGGTLSNLATTISPFLLTTGVNEVAAASAIFGIGTGGNLVKTINDYPFLGVPSYRSALRDKWNQKQQIIFDANKQRAEDLVVSAGPGKRPGDWPRFIADEVNYRIYDYARTCTRPELHTLFDQLISNSRVGAGADVTEVPVAGAPATSRRYGGRRAGEGESIFRSPPLPRPTVVR